MSKKEFTDASLMELDNLSDIELIELMNKGILGINGIEVVKSLLDRRLKRSLHDLTETTKKNTRAQDKYNKILIGLTIVLVILTVIMVMPILT